MAATPVISGSWSWLAVRLFSVAKLSKLLTISLNFILDNYAGAKNLATVWTSLSPRPEQLITIRGLPLSCGHRVSR